MRRDWTPLYVGINTSEKLADLPDDESRLFFVLLLAQCDSWGRVGSRPRQLNVRVWPLLGKTPHRVAEILEAFVAVGLVSLLTHEGEAYLEVVGWEEKAGAQLRRYRGKPTVGPICDILKESPQKPITSPYGDPSTDLVRSTDVVALHREDKIREDKKREDKIRKEEKGASAPKPRSARRDGVAELRFALDEREAPPALVEAAEAYRKRRVKRRHPLWERDQWAKLFQGHTNEALIEALEAAEQAGWQSVHPKSDASRYLTRDEKNQAVFDKVRSEERLKAARDVEIDQYPFRNINLLSPKDPDRA